MTDGAGAEAYLRSCAGSAQLTPGSLAFRGSDPDTPYRCDGALLHAPVGETPGIVFLAMRPQRQSVAGFAALNEKIAELSQSIAERTRAQDALARSEERYRTVLAATTSVVMVADAAGEFVEPQLSWDEFTGQRWPESRGFGWIDALDAAERERFRGLWLANVAASSVFECEARLCTPGGGKSRYCLFRAAPIRHSGGAAAEWVITVTDIDERKGLDEQIRQTQKLDHLGLLAGGVAHDFNNLLVGILGNAALALETTSVGNPAAGLLQEVIAAAETAAHLTRQLLAYPGKGRITIESLDLSEVVRQIGGLVKASIPKSVQLRYDLAQTLPCVEGDASQLQQLTMNLILNGAEAIGPESAGTVLVSTGLEEVNQEHIQSALAPAEVSPGRYVTLQVHDTGAGMTPEVMERIFDPFFTTKFAGRGLGLAAVLGIVRAHQGALKVYSTPGEGTTFKVLFPATAGRPPQRPEESGLAARGSGEMVLVADDEVVVRQATKNMLERRGYRVVLADNGREAVDLFRVLGDKVAVVLLDMTMPVMSGEDAFRELKQIRPDARVVLTSGYNEAEAVRRFSGKGLAGFIQKPFSSSRLIEKIRSVIDGVTAGSE